MRTAITQSGATVSGSTREHTGFPGMHTARNQGDDDQIPDGVDLEVDPKAALPTRLRLRPTVAELPTLHVIRVGLGELDFNPNSTRI